MNILCQLMINVRGYRCYEANSSFSVLKKTSHIRFYFWTRSIKYREKIRVKWLFFSIFGPPLDLLSFAGLLLAVCCFFASSAEPVLTAADPVPNADAVATGPVWFADFFFFPPIMLNCLLVRCYVFVQMSLQRIGVDLGS